MIIGIDASNFRRGGGLTHLIEVLSTVNIHKHNVSKVIIWGGEQSLSQINNFPWLKKIFPKELNYGLFSRLIWQKFRLSNSAKDNNCDLIFSPGGSVLCNFRPIVTMSQNILPFEWNEARRYGVSLESLRLLFLWKIQSKSFRSADGVIFLTNYAKKQVTKVVGKIKASSAIIPHGLNSRFCISPKKQYDMTEYSLTKPFHILYVSSVDLYKHQWNVVEAVAKLRKEGYPVALNLVGAALFAKNRLEKSLKNDCSFRNSFLDGVFTVPGDGCINYKPLLKILYDNQYQEWLVVEAEQDPAKANPYKYAKIGFEYLTNILSSVGYKI